MKMPQRYGAYKESGVDWLGRAIPVAWQLKRMKGLAFLQSGGRMLQRAPCAVPYRKNS